MRRFQFLIGNPPVATAIYETTNVFNAIEQAWEQAYAEYGTNVFIATAQMREILEETE